MVSFNRNGVINTEMQADIYLPSNIEYLRNIKGTTQQELANYLGYGYTTIGNWEKGIRKPDVVDLKKMADYFEISVDDLLTKDLRIDNSFDEIEILFSKNKQILTDGDKALIKTIIEQRKKDIDKELGKS